MVKAFNGINNKDIYTEVGFPDWSIGQMGGILRFDMYIPKYNLLLDFHGAQHYARIKYYQTDAMFARQKQNDAKKYELCPKNDYNYVVFSFVEDIDNKDYVYNRLKNIIGG